MSRGGSDDVARGHGPRRLVSLGVGIGDLLQRLEEGRPRDREPRRQRRSASASKRAAGLKQELTDIRTAAPSLKSHAPKKVKPALSAALSFVNLAYTTLASVHWSITALFQDPAKGGRLEAAVQTLDARTAPLKNYYDKVCKFK